jgi:m7GpppX diphosphatase
MPSSSAPLPLATQPHQQLSAAAAAAAAAGLLGLAAAAICTAAAMSKRSAAEAQLPEAAEAGAAAAATTPAASALADFKPTEVIHEEPSFRVVEGELKGVRTLLKVKRQQPEVSMPPESGLPWQLQSESGAEYSYYSATCTDVVSTDFTVEMISPASDAKVDRERPQKSAYFEESAELYAEVSRPLIGAQLAKDEAKLRAKLGASDTIHSKIGWLHNVLSGSKEAERVLHSDDTFLMNVDTKWATHPDCNSTPRTQWHGHPSTDHLYCLAIVRDTSLPTLRELRGSSLPMLRAILQTGCDTIRKIYGVEQDQLRVFFHYHPQFYHLHVHFTRSHVNPGCEAERAHLLTDVIQNLEMDGEYYAKRSITIRLRERDALYKALSAVTSGGAK